MVLLKRVFCDPCPKGFYAAGLNIENGDTGKCTTLCKANSENAAAWFNSNIGVLSLAANIGLGVWNAMIARANGQRNGRRQSDLSTTADVKYLPSSAVNYGDNAAVAFGAPWYRDSDVADKMEVNNVQFLFLKNNTIIANYVGEANAHLSNGIQERADLRKRQRDFRTMNSVQIAWHHHNYHGTNGNADITFARADADRLATKMLEDFFADKSKNLCFCAYDTAYGGQSVQFELKASMSNGKYQDWRCPSCAV